MRSTFLNWLLSNLESDIIGIRGEIVVKQKVSKAYKRRLITFGSLSVFMIIYFIITSVQYIININQLVNEQEKLSNELLTLKQREEDLKIEIQKLQDPDYIARYARENYLYSKDGEYVIRIEPKEQEEPEKTESKDYKKYIGWSAAGMVVIVLLLIRKK